MSIEGQGHFLTLAQGHLHMKIKVAFLIGPFSAKGLGSQTGFFGPVFFPKSQKPLAVLLVIFSFI